MAWLELHQEVPYHPKTDALMDSLDVVRPHAVGLVVSSWAWALQYAKDGYIAPQRLTAISRGSGWNGDPEMFAIAMTNAEWWQKTADGWLIHDWSEYAGKFFEKRAADAQRKSVSRSAPKSTGVKNVRRTSVGRPTDGAGNNKHEQHEQTCSARHAHDMHDARGEQPGNLPEEKTAAGETVPEAPPLFRAPPSEAIRSAARAQQNRLAARQRASAWTLNPEQQALVLEAGEAVGLTGLALPGEIAHLLAKATGDTDTAYDAWFAFDAETMARWCEAAVAQALLKGSPNLGYVAGIVRGRLNSGGVLPGLKPSEAFASVPAVKAPANPLEAKPWWFEWTIVTGLPDRERLTKLLGRALKAYPDERQRLLEVFDTQGLEAAMDGLWSMRQPVALDAGG